MTAYAVETVFKGRDQVSSVTRRMGVSVDKFGRKAEKSMERASRSALKFKTVSAGMLAANAISRGLSVIEQGAASVVSEFLQFDQAITTAAAKFPDRIKRGTKEFRELENAAREVGATTEFTGAQAALGLEEYAKAGIDAGAAMGLLAGTAELATNANVEFATAADFALTALDAFNLRSKDAAVTTANLARVNDTLTAVVNSAKLDVEDFNETLKFTGPVAAAVGASLEDMASATGLVAKAGIKGSLAGTALKNMYLGLADQTPKSAKVLKDLNLTITDQDGNLRDALDVLVEFSAATDDMGNAQRLASINAVFGQRALSGVSKIMSLGADEISNYRDKLNESRGASAAMAEEIRKSLSNKLLVLQSTAVETGFRILDAFKHDGKEGVEALTAAMRDLDVKPIVKDLKSLFSGLKKVFKFLWNHKDTIATMVKLFVAWKVAMLGLGIAKSIRDYGGLAKSIWKVVASQKAMQALGVGGQAIGGGQFGPVAPIGKTGALGAGVGKLGGAGFRGVATVAGGAILAGFAGWEIGSWIEESLTGPMNDAAATIRDAASNALLTAREAVGRGDLKSMGVAQIETTKSLRALKETTLGIPDVLLNTEYAAGSLMHVFETVASVFSDEVEATKSPYVAYRDQITELTLTSKALSLAMQRAAAANAAAAQGAEGGGNGTIDLNIAGAPEGSTVKSSSPRGAPRINTAMAGAQ